MCGYSISLYTLIYASEDTTAQHTQTISFVWKKSIRPHHVCAYVCIWLPICIYGWRPTWVEGLGCKGREKKERKKKTVGVHRGTTEGRRDLFTFRRVSDSRDENQRNFLSRLCVWVSLAARCRHRYFRIFDEAMSIAYDITKYPWLIYTSSDYVQQTTVCAIDGMSP